MVGLREKLKQSWKEYQIKDIGFLYGGLTGKNKKDFGVGEKFITYMNVFGDSQININNASFVRIKKDENQNKVKSGDIFFTTSSETPEEVGMSSVLLDDFKNDAYLNSFCFGLRLNSFKILSPNFARFLFRSPVLRKKISNLAQGSTRFNLSKRYFLEIKLNIPSLKIQQEIAEILSKVDENIEAMEEVIKKTEELKKGLMQELLTKGVGHKKFKKTKLGMIPESWFILEIGEVGKIITGNTPPTKNRKNYGNDFIWVSPGDMNGQKYIVKSKKMLSKSGFKKIRKISSQSIMVVCVGSTIGKVAMSSFEMSTNQQINSIIPFDSFDNNYIYYQLIFSKNKIINKSSTQAVPIINKTLFSKIQIAIPKLEEQKEIARILSKVDEKIEVYQEIKEKLEIIKKGLMQDLLK